ncbi:hypothetical protein [Shewanella waksmanii]|uniref:hypothetical protein n=1 Tax=Shewanella waksmanii TaxID=213783 RepID=UPI003736F930
MKRGEQQQGFYVSRQVEPPASINFDKTMPSYDAHELVQDHQFDAGTRAVSPVNHVSSNTSKFALSMIPIALAAHIILLLALHHLWRNADYQIEITAPQAPKIQAYTVTAAQLAQWQADTQTPLLPETETETETETENQEVSPNVEDEPEATVIVDDAQLDQDEAAPLVNKQTVVSNPPQLNYRKPNTPQYFERQIDKRFTQKAIDPNNHNVSSFTQSYMQKQHQQAMDALVADSAASYTSKKSMSALTADMLVLELPTIDFYDTALTLDNELDPNRVVKIGDTCYRIAKVPTPLNPHAENIGFPFNCTGDKVKKAIQAAVAKRLQKMHHHAVKNSSFVNE